jgi:hypothetical protein
MESPLFSCPADVLPLILKPLGQAELAAHCLTCAELAVFVRQRQFQYLIDMDEA